MDFPVESQGIRLASMPVDQARRLRRRFGDEKYGEWLRPCSMLAEGYIETIDLMNYVEFANERGEVTPEQYAELMLDLETFAFKLRNRMGLPV